ncbi:hypothetical protein [Nocardia jejuensis]|uniref:hypothetical protein n=1 Tax=Nocardia jejuensis TaxID=328049 RepID=UPI0012F76571|nr:hypothetical protein [Nocardia jejuensis]
MANRTGGPRHDSGDVVAVWPDPSPLHDWWEAVVLGPESGTGSEAAADPAAD